MAENSATVARGVQCLRGERMPNTYTAVTKQDGEWWIGWIAEIPGVNCQERTRAELLASLKATLAEAFDLNRNDGALFSDGK